MPAPAAASAAAGLRVRLAPPRATVSFDRLGTLGVPGLGEAFTALRRRFTGDVRVVVLRGGDWSPAPARGTPPDERQLEAAQAGVDWLSGRADLLSVAVIEGTAEGFGLDLALAADLRIACEDAVLWWAPAGSYPPALLGGHDSLLSLVGYPRALEWRIAGHRLAAAEAMAAGIVSRVAPPEQLDDTVSAFVAGLLAAPRAAVAETKALLLSARERREGRVAALRDEREAFLRLC